MNVFLKTIKMVSIHTSNGRAMSALLQFWRRFSESPDSRILVQFTLRIASLLGDGRTTPFNFLINSPDVSTDGIKAWKNGVEVTSSITKTVTGVTFTTAPANNDVIVVLREIAG